MTNPGMHFVTPPKRDVFVSYHHGADRKFYEQFSSLFCSSLWIAEDHSVRKEINSRDPDYVIRRIREEYITGSSCTIVLCGTQTALRRFVDWEIYATLEKANSGLLGVVLPTAHSGFLRAPLPARLQDNLNSGFAVLCAWEEVVSRPAKLGGLIEMAKGRSRILIDNSRPKRLRSGSDAP